MSKQTVQSRKLPKSISRRIQIDRNVNIQLIEGILNQIRSQYDKGAIKEDEQFELVVNKIGESMIVTYSELRDSFEFKPEKVLQAFLSLNQSFVREQEIRKH